MPLWSLDDWQYLEKEVVTDPKGREWTVALMDVLGQKGDPDRPNTTLELEYSSGRYFTLIYSADGGMQFEEGYPSLPEAHARYVDLLAKVVSGGLDPGQPVLRIGDI